MAAMLLAPVLALAAPFAGIVMDARTGKVLWEQNSDTRLHPASLTKMLTLYIAFDAIRRGEISEDDMVTVSANAARQPPSRLGLRAGQRISLRHLIRAAAIKSANDAASAIGDHISGSEAAFAARMNRTAKALGMTRSTFRNANGLTADGHLSTARDMTLLGRRLFYDFPEYYGIFSRKSDDAGIARVANTNRRFLDGYRGADGIKTGYTNAAGFNLTASAERGNKRLIATVFGGTSTAQRNARISDLLDIGFGNAPATVRTSPPPPVALDQVAEAKPATQGGAGKTIRLKTARDNSPRPLRRPDMLAPEAVAQVTSGVADVLAGLAAPAPAPAVPAVQPQARPEDLVVAAAPEAEEAPEETPVEVAVAPTEDAPAPDTAMALAAAAPPPRPEELLADAATETPSAAVEAAATEIAAVEPDPAPVPFQIVAEAGEDADLPDDLPVPVAEDGESLPGAIRTAGALVVPDLAETTPARRPRARPGEIVMTMASAAPAAAIPENVERTVAAAAGEVVTRVSTSGGRHWAITLGKFNSRGTAERALLQTALSETRALDGALRKVVQRSGAWEATFAGLTQDQADLACRRLQARAIGCFTLGP